MRCDAMRPAVTTFIDVSSSNHITLGSSATIVTISTRPLRYAGLQLHSWLESDYGARPRVDSVLMMLLTIVDTIELSLTTPLHSSACDTDNILVSSRRYSSLESHIKRDRHDSAQPISRFQEVALRATTSLLLVPSTFSFTCHSGVSSSPLRPLRTYWSLNNYYHRISFSFHLICSSSSFALSSSRAAAVEATPI